MSLNLLFYAADDLNPLQHLQLVLRFRVEMHNHIDRHDATDVLFDVSIVFHDPGLIREVANDFGFCFEPVQTGRTNDSDHGTSHDNRHVVA